MALRDDQTKKGGRRANESREDPNTRAPRSQQPRRGPGSGLPLNSVVVPMNREPGRFPINGLTSRAPGGMGQPVNRLASMIPGGMGQPAILLYPSAPFPPPSQARALSYRGSGPLQPGSQPRLLSMGPEIRTAAGPRAQIPIRPNAAFQLRFTNDHPWVPITMRVHAPAQRAALEARHEARRREVAIRNAQTQPPAIARRDQHGTAGQIPCPRGPAPGSH